MQSASWSITYGSANTSKNTGYRIISGRSDTLDIGRELAGRLVEDLCSLVQTTVLEQWHPSSTMCCDGFSFGSHDHGSSAVA